MLTLNFSFDHLLRREQDLQRQVTLSKNQLRDLRVSNESNQAKLFDHNQKQGKICHTRGLFYRP